MGMGAESLEESLILRCSTVVSDSQEGRRVFFKPTKITKGSLTDDMLSEEGLLQYSMEVKKEALVELYYILYVRKTGGESIEEPFGYDCEIKIIADMEKISEEGVLPR